MMTALDIAIGIVLFVVATLSIAKMFGSIAQAFADSADREEPPAAPLDPGWLERYDADMRRAQQSTLPPRDEKGRFTKVRVNEVEILREENAELRTKVDELETQLANAKADRGAYKDLE